jgi:protocatechuate 3,4-dioxygenase beta subunit
MTDDAGRYAFVDMLPGTYSIRADKAGFTPDLVEYNLQRTKAAGPEDFHLYPTSAVTLLRTSSDNEQEPRSET